MKNKVKRTLSFLLTFVMLCSLLPAMAMAAQGDVTASKKAAYNQETGEVKITMTVKGENSSQTIPSKADVVLVVDNSGSMASEVGEPCETPKEKFIDTGWGWVECPNCGARYYHGITGWFVPDICEGETGSEPRINTAQKVGKTFAKSILSENNENNMAVIGFAGDEDWFGHKKDAIKVEQKLTNDVEVINGALDQMEANGGTDYTSALQAAYDMLNERANTDRPGYVVFISDGAPGLQGESIGDSDWDGSNQAEKIKAAGYELYTIGIALDDDANDYLSKLASDREHYKNVTGISYAVELEELLKEWAEEINTVPAGTDAVLVDTISDKFTLKEGQEISGLTFDYDKNQVTWNIGEITEEGKEVSFVVIPNAGVYGNDLPTNAGAVLTYTNAKGEPATLQVDSAEVNIPAPPIEKVKVTYEVEGEVPEGAPAVPAPAEVEKGTKYQVEAAPADITTADGIWHFNGWMNGDKDVTGQEIMVNDTITLTGSWTFTPNPVEEKKIIVNFNKVGGTWADGVTEDAKTFVLSSTTPTAEMDVPEVVAPAGKKLSHWENNWEKLTTLPENGIFTYNSMAAIVGTEQNELYITWNPVYEDIPVEKTLRIHWAIDDPEGATWADGSNAPKTETIAWADKNNFRTMPELEIAEGYKLAGWSVSGTESQYWGADTTTFSLGDQLIVEDENGGFVSITANIVKDEEPVEKTLKIHWAIDNPEGAAWKLYEGNARTETIAWADRGNTFVMPELEIKDGYKLAGWSVSGTEGQYWDPETYEFGLTGLIVEDENGGQVSITANVVKDEVSTEDKIANVYFTVNPKYGYFKEYGEGPVSFENIDADSTQQFEVPEVVAKSGYKFVGWEGKGAGEIKWDANASTFGVPGLCYFPEGSNVGRADIRAVFEKEGGGHINDYAVTVIVDGKGEVKTKDYGTVGSNDTDVIWIPDFEDSVKFTMEPADGWKIDDVLVNGKSIGAEDSYVFETEDLMDGPELKVIFEKKSGGSSGGSHDKDDDKDKDKAPDKTPDALNGEDHFNYIVGDADGKVHPERNITRAEVASIFFRLLKDDVRSENLTDQNTFADVSADDWYNVAVSTMSDMGIVFGRTDYQFDPDAYITRAEFAAIAARFDSESYSGDDLFTDIEGHWAENQINRAAEKGWITGYPDGTFDPNRYITRAEAVTMINRVLNRMPEDEDALHEDMKVFVDNADANAWYYLAIQEATNSHEYEKDDDGVYETWTDVLPDRDWAQYLKLN
nr:S-layer homology domain-containing protein [uncultured Anaerotignum sp.]